MIADSYAIQPDVFNATDSAVPALELIDACIEPLARATRAPRKVHDTISANAANAAIVLGGSFTRAVPCAGGDVFHAGYRPLGSISVRFRWACS